MKQETETFLQKLAEQQESLRAEATARPGIIEKAMQEYRQLPDTMPKLVSKFNASDIAQRMNISLVLDGPLYQDRSNWYTLRLITQPASRNGKVFLIGAPTDAGFEDLKLTVTTWSSNLTLTGVKSNLSNYAPGQQPKRERIESYKLTQIDMASGWILENAKPENAVGFEQLFDEMIHKLVVASMGNVK
jgi:hypothetical protein